VGHPPAWSAWGWVISKWTGSRTPRLLNTLTIRLADQGVGPGSISVASAPGTRISSESPCPTSGTSSVRSRTLRPVPFVIAKHNVAAIRQAARALLFIIAARKCARSSQPTASASQGHSMPVAIGTILANIGTRRVAKKSNTITVGATTAGMGKIVSARQSGSNTQTNGSTARFVIIP